MLSAFGFKFCTQAPRVFMCARQRIRRPCPDGTNATNIAPWILDWRVRQGQSSERCSERGPSRPKRGAPSRLPAGAGRNAELSRVSMLPLPTSTCRLGASPAVPGVPGSWSSSSRPRLVTPAALSALVAHTSSSCSSQRRRFSHKGSIKTGNPRQRTAATGMPPWLGNCRSVQCLART